MADMTDSLLTVIQNALNGYTQDEDAHALYERLARLDTLVQDRAKNPSISIEKDEETISIYLNGPHTRDNLTAMSKKLELFMLDYAEKV